MTSEQKSEFNAADFFDFISSIVTTFEGDALENYYLNTNKPKCLSDLLKSIFDNNLNSKYCWTLDDDDSCKTVTFESQVDAKKTNTYTYYNITSDSMPCIINFYKMVSTAPNNYKMWKPICIEKYPEWLQTLFNDMIRSVQDFQGDSVEFKVPWLNFKYNGIFCAFTFKKSGMEMDMEQVYQMYVNTTDRNQAFKDVCADISMVFPDGIEPIYGLGICEEFRVAKTINNHFRNIMMLSNFIIIPKQLVARLGFRRIHTLTL